MAAQFNQMFALVAIVTCKKLILNFKWFFSFFKLKYSADCDNLFTFFFFNRFWCVCDSSRIIVWKLWWWVFRCMWNQIFSVCFINEVWSFSVNLIGLFCFCLIYFFTAPQDLLFQLSTQTIITTGTITATHAIRRKWHLDE